MTMGKRGREREQRFFCSISTICFAAGDGSQRCRGNWSKTDPQPNMGPYRYLLPPTTYFKTKLHSILLVPVDDGLVTQSDDHREINCFIRRRNGFAGI